VVEPVFHPEGEDVVEKEILVEMEEIILPFFVHCVVPQKI
jgi:hypothetical protein